MEGMQFDTIYHEHFSYLSLIALEPLFAAHGLDITEITDCRRTADRCALFVAPHGTRPVDVERARIVLDAERAAGLDGSRRTRPSVPASLA